MDRGVKRTAVALVSVLLSFQTAGIRAAQQDSSPPPPPIPPLFQRLQVPLPPENKGGWSVLIATGGGLAGSVSYMTATSGGAVACVGIAGCPSALDTKAMTTLTSLVTRAWPILEPISPSGCSDCVLTFVAVKMRDETGTPLLRTVFWDPGTQGKVAADVRQLVANLAPS